MADILADVIPDKDYREKFTSAAKIYARSTPVRVRLDDLPGSLEYQSGQHMYRTSIHIGQRKLFLGKVQFLTPHADRPILVVYAGAAPSNTGQLLANMFPLVRWLFVDPNPFHIVPAGSREMPPGRQSPLKPPVYLSGPDAVAKWIASGDQISIINDLFTLDHARALYGHDVYFISDIRTNVNDDYPDTSDILWNLSQQYNWIMTMKPAGCLLKFRHPYYNEDNDLFQKNISSGVIAEDFALSKQLGIDFLANCKEKKLVYLDGTIYIQPWAGALSTESRLTIGRELVLRDYGTPNQYQNAYTWYNNIDRCYTIHENPAANPVTGFDHCNDCALEYVILRNYVAKYGGSGNPHTLAYIQQELQRITGRGLLRGVHGRWFGPYKDLRGMIARRYDGGSARSTENMPSGLGRRLLVVMVLLLVCVFAYEKISCYLPMTSIIPANNSAWLQSRRWASPMTLPTNSVCFLPNVSLYC
jgi:hypothetical protein